MEPKTPGTTRKSFKSDFLTKNILNLHNWEQLSFLKGIISGPKFQTSIFSEPPDSFA